MACERTSATGILGTPVALARALESGRLSPVEVTGAVLVRIEGLNSFVTVASERAMEAAREDER